jgi:sterol desaturase/sphingolipid hydroxylase (fatty acid hydroxylase superfamily)
MNPMAIEPGLNNVLDAAYLGTLLRGLMYLVPAFLTYLIVWKIFGKRWQASRIMKREPNNTQLWFEIRHSLQTVVIWGLLSLIHIVLMQKGYTKIYFDFSEHSLAYYALSLVAVILIHDTYFYWTHRMMHHPRLFRLFHATHHRSANPTPWAIFSFQPAEAVVQFGITFILVFAMPLHISVHVFWTIWLLAFNLMGHLGYELYPKGFTTNRFVGWINSATHHAMHHKFVSSNFGLYFTFWDHLMGTMHGRYHETFESIKSGEKL